MFIYFWERERENKQGRGTERGRKTIPKGLCADSKQHDAGLELINHEIITWAKVGCLTEWATQVPLTTKFNAKIDITYSFFFYKKIL